MHAMQSFFLTALATVATAHYVFPSVIEDGVATPPWADVRQYTTYYTNNPVTDVTSVDIRCNVGGSTISSNTTTVNAGDNIGFTVTPNIYRKIPYICYLLNLSLTKSTDPGPAQAYMAKAPSGTNIATWDGSGDVWFKIFGQGPSSFAASGLTWPSMDASSVMFTIPKDLPTGDYLVRVEQIGLHVASTEGGAQLQMRKQYAADDGIVWQCADVRNLQESACSVDIAFDKGTLDAMIYGSPWNPPEEVKANTGRYMEEVARTLKDDGIFLYVTYRQPHFVKPLLNRDDWWDLAVETLSDGEGSFEYYGFVLRKKEDKRRP
ncbi:MAG: hypothetical protein M1821_003655 [Bathelium mastoideum]|nr:MAG: hypothetical protein M1821_003655 [Bathelium mastoideum]